MMCLLLTGDQGIATLSKTAGTTKSKLYLPHVRRVDKDTNPGMDRFEARTSMISLSLGAVSEKLQVRRETD